PVPFRAALTDSPSPAKPGSRTRSAHRMRMPINHRMPCDRPHREAPMKTLVIDIGGTNVKLWLGEKSEKIPSGKTFTPQHLVDAVHPLIRRGECERISIGYPGDVRH